MRNILEMVGIAFVGTVVLTVLLLLILSGCSAKSENIFTDKGKCKAKIEFECKCDCKKDGFIKSVSDGATKVIGIK